MWVEDPTLPPLPWQHGSYNSTQKLTFGYIVNDQFFEPAPACKRAVEDVVQKLKAHTQHEVIPLQVSQPKETTFLQLKCSMHQGHLSSLSSFLESLNISSLQELPRMSENIGKHRQ